MKRAGAANSIGLSLVELTLVLAIVMLVSFTAYPNLAKQYREMKFKLDVEQLYSHLKHARTQALSQMRYVVICPSLDLNQCDTDWTAQIMMFIDLNRNTSRDPQETLLSVVSANPSLSVNRALLQFAPSFLSANSAATLTFCVRAGQRVRGAAIVISTMGRIRMEKEPSNLTVSCG